MSEMLKIFDLYVVCALDPTAILQFLDPQSGHHVSLNWGGGGDKYIISYQLQIYVSQFL